MTRIIIAALFSILTTAPAFAGKPSGGHDNRPEKPGKTPTTTANAGAVAGAVGIGSGGNATAAGGAGGNAAGGYGGSVGSITATTGNTSFSPVMSWTSASVPSSTKATIKNVADPNPPTMPATANCMAGISGGLGFAGGVFSIGTYYESLLCLWERQHAIQVAVSDEDGARKTRDGMTMLLCEKTPPEQRKYFDQCEAFDRKQQQGAQPSANPAFSSAG